MDMLKTDVKKIFLKYLSASFGSALIAAIYSIVEAREKKDIKKLERRETIDKAAQGVRKIFKRNSKDKIDKEGETIDEQEGKEKA